MRPISSARASAFLSTASFPSRIIRSRSCNCITATSFASVNSRLLKVIVNRSLPAERWRYPCRERQKSFLTQMRFIRNGYLRAIRPKHPDRNLQSLPHGVHDRDGPIPPLRSADHLQGSPMKRVERIEDLDLCVFRAQGIVSVECSSPSALRGTRWRNLPGRQPLGGLPSRLLPTGLHSLLCLN